MKSRDLFLSIVLPLAVGIPTASATTIFFDTFTDGARDNGADATDTAWYLTSTNNTSVSVVNTTPLGSGFDHYLLVNNDTSSSSTFDGINAAFNTTTLAVGQMITLTFDFRAFNTSNAGNAFRWGIGSNATAYTADGTPAPSSATNDQAIGYYAAAGIGSSALLSVNRDPGESGSANGFTNGSILGLSSVTGSDGVNTTTVQSALLRISHTTSGNLTILAQLYNGTGSSGTPLSEVSAAADVAITSFNQVTIAPGNHTNFDFDLDNINLVVSPIPEPRAALLGGLGMLALLRRRR